MPSKQVEDFYNEQRAAGKIDSRGRPVSNKTEAPELLPCPFCGGDYQTWQHVRDGRTLGCSKCGARFTEYNGPPDNSAETRLVNAWNTRADLSDAKDKRIFALDGNRQALEAEITDMHETYKARIAELEAELASWQSAQNYSYIGVNGKQVRAVDLENRAIELEAKLAKAVAVLERATDDIEKGWLSINGIDEKYNTDGSWHVVQDARANLAELQNTTAARG